MPSEDSTSSSGSNEPVAESSSSGFQVSLIAGHNIWEWIFLVVSAWNVALLLASSGIAVAQCDLQHSLLSPEFMTEVIVIIVSVLALAFAVYGVHEEHQFDIYLHLIFAFAADFFSYLAALKNCYSCFKIVCFYVSGGMTLVNTFFAYKATTAADWTEFRIIGASESLAAMYKKQCAFLSLLKFDSLFVLICALFSFPVTLDFPNKTNLYILLCLIVIYSFLSWFCGKVTVCKEDKYLASGFIVLCITYPCLIIYQMYMSNHKVVVENIQFHQTAQYIGIIIIICKLSLTCLMVQTCRTFGYGLNTRSLDVLKKWLERPSKNKSSSNEGTWLKFLKESCHIKCATKAKETEYTYKDIYRF
ncbi:uncharacterized protein LOC129233647 [Uloborus diversus]|uniref:uncharacterized protein LOC129233647 n=1 Tax=Uloborus diversus TaxID=327109 RepID=UPI00240935A8|nr:uncharacterized protein LOC129233647 [Uloborus diversus]